MLLQKAFAFLLARGVVIENIEGIQILVFWIDAVAANPPPSPLERSCITAIESMISSPQNRFPSFAKIPEIAQPDSEFLSGLLCAYGLPPCFLCFLFRPGRIGKDCQQYKRKASIKENWNHVNQVLFDERLVHWEYYKEHSSICQRFCKRFFICCIFCKK